MPRKFASLLSFALVIGAVLAQTPPASPPATLAKDIAQARSDWQSESARIRDLLVRMKGLATSLEGLVTDIARSRGALKKLIAEKEDTLDEMRKGLFCSGCGKTKRQILAAGQEFPHSGQHIIPADPKQLKAAEDGFDQRIAELKKKLVALEDDERKKKHDLDALYFEFMTRPPVYHAHFGREQDLRMREWGNEKTSLEAPLEQLEIYIRDAERAVEEAKNSGLTRRLENELRNLQAALAPARAAQARADEQVAELGKPVQEIEAKLRAAESADDRQRLQDSLTSARDALTRAEPPAKAARKQVADLGAKVRATELAQKKHADQLQLLDTNLRILQRQFTDSLAKARLAQGRAEQQAQSYVQAALKNLEETAAVAEPLPQKFGLPGGWFISRVIQNANPAIGCNIAPLRGFDAASRSAALRDRLEERTGAPARPASSAKKSMKDLLEEK